MNVVIVSSLAAHTNTATTNSSVSGWILTVIFVVTPPDEKMGRRRCRRHRCRRRHSSTLSTAREVPAG